MTHRKNPVPGLAIEGIAFYSVPEACLLGFRESPGAVEVLDPLPPSGISVKEISLDNQEQIGYPSKVLWWDRIDLTLPPPRVRCSIRTCAADAAKHLRFADGAHMNYCNLHALEKGGVPVEAPEAKR